MDRNEIFNKVAHAVATTFEVAQDELSEETTLDELSADSLDRVELLTELEEEFDTTVDDDVLVELSTLGECVDAIEEALG